LDKFDLDTDLSPKGDLSPNGDYVCSLLFEEGISKPVLSTNIFFMMTNFFRFLPSRFSSAFVGDGFLKKFNYLSPDVLDLKKAFCEP
jgi:hypothetical protein